MVGQCCSEIMILQLCKSKSNSFIFVDATIHYMLNTNKTRINLNKLIDQRFTWFQISRYQKKTLAMLVKLIQAICEKAVQ